MAECIIYQLETGTGALCRCRLLWRDRESAQ
jgi:hypothetical protein